MALLFAATLAFSPEPVRISAAPVLNLSNDAVAERWVVASVGELTLTDPSPSPGPSTAPEWPSDATSNPWKSFFDWALKK